ncbi:MAG: PEP-CTERM sorting domain-containing protein [Lentisphaerae bacterium]|nr:PEP-CTERM sorting domain-containing protein [Lentisphaerota bacterium]
MSKVSYKAVLITVGLALLLVPSVVLAAGSFEWYNISSSISDPNGDLVPNDSTWVLQLYESPDATVDPWSTSPWGGSGATGPAGPTVNDVYTGLEITWASGGAAGYFYAFIDGTASDYGLTKDDNVYTVLWNSSTVGNATYFLVLDGSQPSFSTTPFPSTDPPGSYDTSGSPGGVLGDGEGGEWQLVPEPGAMFLFALGVMTIAARRKLRK